MTFGNRRTHKHTSTTSVALAMAASLFGSAGCEQAEPEESAQVMSALGSTQTQETIDNWTEFTQMVPGGNYLLTVDLNAAGKAWNPISFTGTFDGGNKTISNLTINSTGSGSGFFKEMNNAIVRRVRFTNLTVTDSYMAGGIASIADDSLIELVGVQGTISGPNAFAVGGLVGMGAGTTIRQSFVKGTVSGGAFITGGIIGALGNLSSRGLVYQSYVWANVTANAPSGVTFSSAGGIAGALNGASIQEVYVVGNVTGRAHVGGLAGDIWCDDDQQFVLNKGIYRGDVIDQDWTPSGGWAGTFGTFMACPSRFDQLIWDSNRDGSSNSGSFDPPPQKSATNTALMSPMTAGGGVYSYPDNTFNSGIWAAGSNTQHHALQNMPGGLTIQPRCVNASGVPYAC
jgi:hypothetical protein